METMSNRYAAEHTEATTNGPDWAVTDSDRHPPVVAWAYTGEDANMIAAALNEHLDAETEQEDER